MIDFTKFEESGEVEVLTSGNHGKKANYSIAYKKDGNNKVKVFFNFKSLIDSEIKIGDCLQAIYNNEFNVFLLKLVDKGFPNSRIVTRAGKTSIGYITFTDSNGIMPNSTSMKEMKVLKVEPGKMFVGFKA